MRSTTSVYAGLLYQNSIELTLFMLRGVCYICQSGLKVQRVDDAIHRINLYSVTGEKKNAIPFNI